MIIRTGGGGRRIATTLDPGGQIIEMPFKYSCFFSYAGFSEQQAVVAKRFVDDLGKAIQDEIWSFVRLPVFVDRTHLVAGDFFEERLAKCLCESVCMICVFTPTYFDEGRTFCAREFRAMELLEESRMPRLQPEHGGAIIPISFRGHHYLPPYIKDRRHCYDFSGFTLAERNFQKNPKYSQHILSLCEKIFLMHKHFQAAENHPCDDCQQFRLPTETQIGPWLRDVVGKPWQPPFPGIEEDS
jgi:hypothetical protein